MLSGVARRVFFSSCHLHETVILMWRRFKWKLSFLFIYYSESVSMSVSFAMHDCIEFCIKEFAIGLDENRVFGTDCPMTNIRLECNREHSSYTTYLYISGWFKCDSREGVEFSSTPLRRPKNLSGPKWNARKHVWVLVKNGIDSKSSQLSKSLEILGSRYKICEQSADTIVR